MLLIDKKYQSKQYLSNNKININVFCLNSIIIPLWTHL